LAFNSQEIKGLLTYLLTYLIFTSVVNPACCILHCPFLQRCIYAGRS